MDKEFLVFKDGDEVSTRLHMNSEKFKQVEKALKPLGITFRGPRR